ncbi:SURF1 family-domain-containing protein [Xylariaceae sp. FL0804]|nr:SURF1 family-domain-containing protein [Xylariaceae sp. FL0804]
MKSPSCFFAPRPSLARRVEQSIERQIQSAHASGGRAPVSSSSSSSSSSATTTAPSRRFQTRAAPRPRSSLFSPSTDTAAHPRPPPPPQRGGHCHPRRPFSHTRVRGARPGAENPADEPGFTSPVDHPPTLVRVQRRRHGWGLLVLAAIPLTAFGLGTWQVQRLGWKTELLARLEDRLVQPPLPLPPHVDPQAVRDFDYRRVRARGILRHDREMLVGPRTRDGADGFLVVTPLERAPLDETAAADAAAAAAQRREGRSESGEGDGSTEGVVEGAGREGLVDNATILVNRGWIDRAHRDRRTRHPDALPTGEVRVEGLLRQPWKKNVFTPDNRPDRWEFYFPDVHEMAALVGSQPIWVEQTMEPDLLEALENQRKGIPIGRAPEVNLRNNHAQYIFTWYGLAFCTSIMFYMVVKKPAGGGAGRVRANRGW